MTAPTARHDDRLKKLRVVIHIQRTALAMADDAYRALLERVAGVRSSADILSLVKAHAVLDEFERLGASRPGHRPANKTAGGRVNEWRFVFGLTPDRKALCQKIYRCAEKIGARQNADGKPMSKTWVEGIARQAAGLNAAGAVSGAKPVAKPLELCAPEELRTVIQILESWARKKGA